MNCCRKQKRFSVYSETGMYYDAYQFLLKIGRKEREEYIGLLNISD